MQDGLQQTAFPPVAQPEALKASASSSMGSSPCGSLKMQVCCCMHCQHRVTAHKSTAFMFLIFLNALFKGW